MRKSGCSSFLEITALYLQCTEVQLRLYTLFEATNSPDRPESLLKLFNSCDNHLSFISDPTNASVLTYCPNYVFQVTLAAGFAVLKLSQSPIVDYLDVGFAKKSFNSAVMGIRKISVSNNDLPGRLAEVLVQLKARRNALYNRNAIELPQLQVRGRMSMSVLWDSLLEWRKGFEGNGNDSTGMSITVLSSLI
jgi:hypothetical protein